MNPNNDNSPNQEPSPVADNAGSRSYVVPQPTQPFQPIVQPTVVDTSPAVSQAVITPSTSPSQEQQKSTSRDKLIGIIMGIIGALGAVGAALSMMDFYNHVPGSGQTPPSVFFIVPLLFLYSGYYYIGGLNAQRIQRKQGGGSLIKKNYQKFRLVEVLLAVLIIGCVAYPTWYIGNKNNIINQTTAESSAATSTSDKAALDKKRTEVATNLATAERKFQKDHQGQINSILDFLHVDYTDPATGKNYQFGGELTQPSDNLSYSIHAIHSGQGFKCKPDSSGYMINDGTQSSFAFAIERETMPPICFDFQSTP